MSTNTCCIAATNGESSEEINENVETSQDKQPGKGWIAKLHRKELCGAIWKGDWERAQDLFDHYPDYYARATISQEGDTTLHIVAAATEEYGYGRQETEFVARLLDLMKKEDLEIKNNDENTAFCLAAVSGNLQLARRLFRKNKNLPMIPGKNGTLPICMAAQSGHTEMVKFLFYLIDDGSEDFPIEEHRTKLFHSLILTGLYDIALDLLEDNPCLATARGEADGETALHIMAQMPKMPSNFANHDKQGILKRSFHTFSGNDEVPRNKLPPEELNLVKQLWARVKKSDDSEISEILEKPSRPLFVAAEQGNTEFLEIIISENPELWKKFDKEGRSFAQVAILNRQEDILRLINEMPPPVKKELLKHKDQKGNNILHFAGMLAPQDRLNTVAGAAFQMQEELLWFEKVRDIMQPLEAEAKNEDGKTPKDLFIDRHQDLEKKVEKWMMRTANSCMVVSTLIATVVFAAAFTVPGGTKDDDGTPHLVQKVAFTIFVIADAMSLVSSTCSILTFLSILTTRYAEKDLLPRMHRDLVVGLSTLFLSIAAMMVVFGATIFIVFKDGKIWVPMLVSVIASLPVTLFTMQQWPLLRDLTSSTFKI